MKQIKVSEDPRERTRKSPGAKRTMVPFDYYQKLRQAVKRQQQLTGIGFKNNRWASRS